MRGWQEEASNYSDPENFVNMDYGNLINSINKNIAILETYRDIPQKINELINVKEKYLEQILCNINSISALL
jgi:hypothetical protein